MQRRLSQKAVFSLFYLATFLQAGTYGLTFMLPKLFAGLGGDEKDVGSMLLITTATTLVSVYYSGHLTDKLGRIITLGLSGLFVASSLALFSIAQNLDSTIVIASALLGFGWGTFYTLGPVVLTGITPAQQRVRVFSLNSVFIMAGFGLSPVMASALESMGFDVAYSFGVSAIACVISGVVFFLLKTPIDKLTVAKGNDNPSRITPDSVLRIFKSRARLPIVMVCIGASIFAGMNNFQTVFADMKGLDYADFFLAYTVTVVICRLLLAGFSGGRSPYLVISVLQYIMFASVVLFMFSANNQTLYILVAILFGIGYGASYPILVAMTANDAETALIRQTLQLFALTYFVGIFAFPLMAGWIIVELGVAVFQSE